MLMFVFILFTISTTCAVFQVMVCAPAAFLTPWAYPSCHPTVVRATAQPAWQPCAWRPVSTRRLCCSLPTCSVQQLGLEAAWESCLESAWQGPRWALPSTCPALWEEGETTQVPARLPRSLCWAAVLINTLPAPRSHWRKSEALDIKSTWMYWYSKSVWLCLLLLLYSGPEQLRTTINWLQKQPGKDFADITMYGRKDLNIYLTVNYHCLWEMLNMWGLVNPIKAQMCFWIYICLHALLDSIWWTNTDTMCVWNRDLIPIW